MSNKNIIAVLIAVCALQCVHAQTHMYVELTSGDFIYYKLAEWPKISYTETSLVVLTTSGEQNDFPINHVKTVQYIQPLFIRTEDNIPLIGPISIFSMMGEHITTIEKTEDILTADIPWGVYILRARNISTKFILQ